MVRGAPVSLVADVRCKSFRNALGQSDDNRASSFLKLARYFPEIAY